MAESRREVVAVSQIQIQRPPETVYEFATDPANWVGTHPVTVRVEGAHAGPQETGDSWTEIIKAPGWTYPVRWRVVEVQPPNRWIIRAERFGGTSAIVTITYTFAVTGSGTFFRREMHTLLPAGLLGTVLAPIFKSTTIHDRYMAAVKKHLESANSRFPPDDTNTSSVASI
ncbi:SRPBCC family protein [Aurantimonas sp. VKM B-3413]|uniref:SRPBCC family protein n=1 Tax=Aurantimonas sp. VKM B-3413 TaxID=2779401 RepID=UPI001E2ADFF0|nr:SRPBCC family protein [Aurantimonas sp. VKM B-3413]MCB8839417.1 SRPBCC family protein [Aurantimonas sp. VKM B-3413]